MNTDYVPRILAFLCNWCSYAGADLAGVSRYQYPPTIRVMRTMCSGRVDPIYILEGLRNGFDAVFVFGCHIGDCHYIDGNVYTEQRMRLLSEMLEFSGIGGNRMQLRWVSAAEGQQFADYVKELSAIVQGLGAFDPADHHLSLAAMEAALRSPRLRWLLGIERQLTERGNVYGEKIASPAYRNLMTKAAREEYQKALILESLRNGPLSVKDITGKTGLPVIIVSQLLSDLERTGQAEFSGWDGSTPRFVLQAV